MSFNSLICKISGHDKNGDVLIGHIIVAVSMVLFFIGVVVVTISWFVYGVYSIGFMIIQNQQQSALQGFCSVTIALEFVIVACILFNKFLQIKIASCHIEEEEAEDEAQ